MTSLLTRLVTDEQGQDLVEYALLTATVAVAALLGIAATRRRDQFGLQGWDTRTQDLWEPQAPAAS